MGESPSRILSVSRTIGSVVKPLALLLAGLAALGVLVARPGAGWAQERPGPQGYAAPEDDAAPMLRIPGGVLERPLRFSRLTVEDGLSQGEVLDLHQDRRGFMWIATLNGLNRYDGYEVEVYAPVPFDTTAIADGVVTAVYEDRAGAIWAGTAYVGLARLDPATETFTHYRHDSDDPHSLSGGEVTAVYEDRDGALWVGTTAGLNRMDPDRPGRFTRFAHDPDDGASLSDDRVRSVDEDAEGALWVATADGLNRMDPDVPGRFERFLTGGGEGSSLHRQHAEPGSGVRWIGSDQGLVRFDAVTGEARRFLPYPDRDGANAVPAASPDPWTDGVLWVAVRDEGLARFDALTETFTHHSIDAESPTGLVEHAGSLVYTDRSGVVWVGSRGGGLNTFDPATVGFAHYGAATDGRPGLRNPSVWGLAVTRDGAVWAGTSEGYLHRISRETGEVRVWEADPDLSPDRPSGEANAFAEEPDGTLWVGTTDGLSRYDPQTDTFTHYVHDPDDPASLSDSNVLALRLDRDGVLWVGTASGLNRYEPAEAGGDGAFARYLLDPDDPHSGLNWIAYVAETQDGEIWVAADGAVARLDEGAGRFEVYRHDPTDPATVTSGAFGWLHERAREPGVLWLAGLSGGLDRLDTRTGEVRHYTAESSELPDNAVYAVLEDEAGRLWLSTNRGLARFDPGEPDRSRAFRRFGRASGLQSLEFSQHAAATDPEGRLYFGGVEGINVFHPAAVEGNPVPPLVALTDLRVSNESVPVGAGSPLAQSLAETDAVTLGYDERNVTVEFVGLHFKNPAQNRYRYQLGGFDSGWVEAGTRRTASYTNLPPGDYTFRVAASNSDGVWNAEGRVLSLTVRPPWWGSAWAFVVYALVLASGVVAVDRIQRRRLVARERERARERELAQAKEIERAYTELRAAKDRLVQQEKMASLGQLTAGIAHEIKNPLNFVTGFAGLSRELADELAAAPDDERAEIVADLKANAEKIEAHGRRADAIVAQMMAHARGGSGERRVVSLNALVEEYAELALHGYSARRPDADVLLALDLDDDAGEVEVAPQEIGRVLVNLVDNALDAVRQRAEAEGNGYDPAVTVSTRRAGGGVEVRVEDNGPGMAEGVRARVFEPFFTTKPTGEGTGLGLSLSHDIVVQGHGGGLAVESEEGRGAAFALTLPAHDPPDALLTLASDQDL